MGYVDPNSFGVISQVLFASLFAVVTGLTFFFRPLLRIYRWLLKKP